MKNMHYIFIFVLLFISKKTQATDLEDVALASLYLNSAVQEVGTQKVNCQDIVTNEVKTANKQLEDSPDLAVVQRITSSDEYEKIFRERPKVAPTPEKPFYISIIMQNDKRFGYEQLFHEKSDDAGRTHGGEIHIGKQKDNGVTKDVSISSYLYTQKIRNLFDENGHLVQFSKSGERLTYSHMERGVPVYVNSRGERVAESDITKKPQHFQEVSTLEFVQDNIKLGETLYYKAGVGIVMVVSDKMTALGAAAQQIAWHKMTGKTVYINIGDGEKDRYGVTALGAIGVQKKLEDKKLETFVGSINYSIISSAELGAQGDTISERRAWVKGATGVGIGKKLSTGEHRFEVLGSLELGKSKIGKFEMALNGEDCSLVVSYNFYRNDAHKYAPLDEGTMNFGSKCRFN